MNLLLTEEQPQFSHDCDSCIFLGQFNPTDGPQAGEHFDLYVHLNARHTTTLARYSNRGEDNHSWELGCASHNTAITECARRAYALPAGLLARAHYHLMDHVSFWSDSGDRAGSSILVGKASDLRVEASKVKAAGL